MNLSEFPRRIYTPFDTPIQPLDKLTKELGGGARIWMKRDDLLGLAMGGNKTRKLEYLMADALEKGADTIITCGAIQSNHCRLTLAAAVTEGLKCHLVLEERIPNSYNKYAGGNNLLYHLLGAEGIYVVDGSIDSMTEVQRVADELTAKGRKPYIIPGGGSNAIGATGYARCAQEILRQSSELCVNFDCVICTGGSAGTQAGLIVGFKGENADIPVIGISNKSCSIQKKNVLYVVSKLREHLGVDKEITMGDVIVFDDYIGPGYSISSPEMIDAVKLVARTEGIILDPVYTGKTMAGMIDLYKKGYFKNCENILFIHTGGTPALFTYTEDFFEDEE